MNFEFVHFLCSSSLVILMLLISFYNFLRWRLVYAHYLFLAFLYDSKRQQRLHQYGFQYNASISYNFLDELWLLRELLPNLEADQEWRLCLHHRDCEPGKPINDNIVDSTYSSWKRICVITRSCLRSERCYREIQVASFWLFDEQNDALILVFLEDIPHLERIWASSGRNYEWLWTPRKVKILFFWDRIIRFPCLAIPCVSWVKWNKNLKDQNAIKCVLVWNIVYVLSNKLISTNCIQDFIEVGLYEQMFW